MSSPLIIVATITASAGNEDFVKQECIKMLEPTRKEDGCHGYLLQQDNETPGLFIFYETWESPQHLEAHTKTSHFEAFIGAIEPRCDSIVLNDMTRLDV